MPHNTTRFLLFNHLHTTETDAAGNVHVTADYQFIIYLHEMYSYYSHHEILAEIIAILPFYSQCHFNKTVGNWEAEKCL